MVSAKPSRVYAGTLGAAKVPAYTRENSKNICHIRHPSQITAEEGYGRGTVAEPVEGSVEAQGASLLRSLSLSKGIPQGHYLASTSSATVTLLRPSTPYYEKALFEMLYLDKRSDKCVAPPQLWVKEIIPFGERDVIYD
jgi:hypothetical protein